MRLNLSRLHFPVTTLGPGRRVGIWFQGCSIRCAGCVSADTWGFDRGETTVQAVAEQASNWLPSADGVTISGGEPFDQPAALAELLRLLPLSASQDVLVFSGYPMESITASSALATGRIDALISDPFDGKVAQTLRLRGSDNQRLHMLTALGHERFEEYNRSSIGDERSLDVMFDADGTVWLAGITRQGDMLRLRGLLELQGHAVTTSDSTRNDSAR